MGRMLNFDETVQIYLIYAELKDESDPAIYRLRDDFIFELLLRNLTLKQQLKIRNTKNETDRFIKLLNALLLKYVIAQRENQIGMGGNPVVESRGEYGKPRLDNRNYQFNLSDERGIVMLAIGFDESRKEKEIGIDLAHPGDIQNFGLERLQDFYRSDFKDIFSSAEINKLDTYFNDLKYNEQLVLLSRIWSLKESYSKYIGVGITGGLENFEFTDLDDFDKVNKETLSLKPIKGFDPLNVCFQIPDTEILCSVFAHYGKATLIRIDVNDIIKFYTTK